MDSLDASEIDQDLLRLPLWARTALATQFSRAAFFSTVGDSPEYCDQPRRTHLWVFDALEEACAGRSDPSQVLDRIVAFVQGRRFSGGCRESTRLALDAVWQAAVAVDAAYRQTGSDATAILRCVHLALQAIASGDCGDRDEAIASVMKRLLMVQEAGRLESWTDATFVPREFFGICWADGELSPDLNPNCRYPDQVAFSMGVQASIGWGRTGEMLVEFLRVTASLLLAYGLYEFVVADLHALWVARYQSPVSAHGYLRHRTVRFALRSRSRYGPYLLQSAKLAVHAGMARPPDTVEPGSKGDSVREHEPVGRVGTSLQTLANTTIEDELWRAADRLREKGIDRSQWTGESAHNICLRRSDLITWLQQAARKGIFFRVD